MKYNNTSFVKIKKERKRERERKGEKGRERERKGEKGRERERKGEKGRERERKGEIGREKHLFIDNYINNEVKQFKLNTYSLIITYIMKLNNLTDRELTGHVT